MGVERAGDDPVVCLVGVERSWVAGAQPERCDRFPRMGESVELFEFVDAAGAAEFAEQAAAPNRLELTWVADEDNSPPVAFRQSDQ